MDPCVEPAHARLRRFVASGICNEGDVSKRARDLQQLGRRVLDEEQAREAERFFRALGDVNRLRIIKLLADRELCVCELMVTLRMSQSNASHHLGILERQGLIKRRKSGKWALYSLSSPKVASLIGLADPSARR